ncbi:MAG: sensor histidine kinase [Actinomycetota bacterium]
MSESRFAEMIAKIAHELRSPLTSVKGFSSTLVSRWDRFSDEQKLELVTAIHLDADRMGRIVSEVLDLARLEAGLLELHRTTTDLHKLVSETLQHQKNRPGVDRVNVEVPEGTELFVDCERMLHVLSNLVENAIKFSDDGPITIRGSTDGDHAVIEVRDEGIGIPPERIEDIFLSPAPKNQKAVPLGTGLGLYLSRQLVEAHGGSLAATSTEGRGSVFSLRLPVHRSE